jgi:hypothetical protein
MAWQTPIRKAMQKLSHFTERVIFTGPFGLSTHNKNVPHWTYPLMAIIKNNQNGQPSFLPFEKWRRLAYSIPKRPLDRILRKIHIDVVHDTPQSLATG